MQKSSTFGRPFPFSSAKNRRKICVCAIFVVPLRRNLEYYAFEYIKIKDSPRTGDRGKPRLYRYAGERVQVVDNNNGARLETYVIPGKRGSGCICINGAAAHLVNVGDTVIIMAYALMEPEEAKTFKPAIVFPVNNRL